MEKSKFTNLVNGLSAIAEQDNWIPRYDKSLDYFYWTKESLSKDTELIKISHEASLFISRDKKIEGVFVEYLKGNFIKHNGVYRDFLKQFKKKISNDVYTVENTKEAEKYLFALGEALRADMYQDAKERNYSIDFDKLINFAFSDK